jgi:hypothetical protein
MANISQPRSLKMTQACFKSSHPKCLRNELRSLFPVCQTPTVKGNRNPTTATAGRAKEKSPIDLLRQSTSLLVLQKRPPATARFPRSLKSPNHPEHGQRTIKSVTSPSRGTYSNPRPPPNPAIAPNRGPTSPPAKPSARHHLLPLKLDRSSHSLEPNNTSPLTTPPHPPSPNSTSPSTKPSPPPKPSGQTAPSSNT